MTEQQLKDIQLLESWCRNVLQDQSLQVIPLTGDASFRRYYRVATEQDSYIAMVAPLSDNLDQFIHIAQHLQAQGLNAPLIVAAAKEQGLLLLADLGDELYLNLLNEATAESLYLPALQALLIMQKSQASALAVFDQAFMVTQLEVFRHWYLETHLQLKLKADTQKMLNQIFAWLCAEILQQPYVFTHFDYHSRNLLQVPDQTLGILDFQDAMHGPITYDLSSLLKDSYIQWPRDQVKNWVKNFYQLALNEKLLHNTSFEVFWHWFEITGLQRHLKNLGVFARLHHRDGKPHYLQHLPLLLHYIQEVCESYQELKPLSHFLQHLPQTSATVA